MKLEVGMYVRYKRGSMGWNIEPADKIGKIINQVNQSDIYELDNSNNIFENDVVKASFNIIDLIEVGDYVNGQIVTQIIPNNRKKEPSTMVYTGINYFVGLYNEEIKSIVTHEQMEQMSYKLGE